MNTTYVSPWVDEELAIFRDAVARFVEAEMVPNDEQWRKQQHVGKEIWRKAGAMGLLCTDIAAQYGGVGGDFRHEAVLYEETSRRGISGFGQGVHSICAHYLENHGTEEQKQRFLPRMASGELIGTVALAEDSGHWTPDSVAMRATSKDGGWALNGHKSFVLDLNAADFMALE